MRSLFSLPFPLFKAAVIHSLFNFFVENALNVIKMAKCLGSVLTICRCMLYFLLGYKLFIFSSTAVTEAILSIRFR